MKVVISSGHGKHIRGASGYIDEVDEARRVVETVASMMRSAGATVVTFHDDVSTSQNENLNRIVDFHNSQGRDLDVSVHFNAYETTSKPMGTECLFVTQIDLANKIAEAVADAGGLIDRGPKQRNDLFFLNNTEEPAVLIETCFVDSQADVDAYHQSYNSICAAIASAITGEEIEDGDEPAPPDVGGHPELKKGSVGPEVKELQRKIGVVDADGDFGGITDTWVRAFQGAEGLAADGVVGPRTWDRVDALERRRVNGDPPLPDLLAQKIYTLAQQSEIADFSWPDRGVPPHGYIPGMALCFGFAARAWRDGVEAALDAAKREGHPDSDALAYYHDDFAKLRMDNSRDGIDTLRHLFVMMIGLGPRESSGRYCEGRDLSASNVQSDTCEAGLFQTSWNIRSFSPLIAPLLDKFWDNPNGFQEQFREGIHATADNLNSYGSGNGLRYQWLSRYCPLFHVCVTAIGMRHGRQHWGPINGGDVFLNPDADVLLREVQDMVLSTS